MISKCILSTLILLTLSACDWDKTAREHQEKMQRQAHEQRIAEMERKNKHEAQMAANRAAAAAKKAARDRATKLELERVRAEAMATAELEAARIRADADRHMANQTATTDLRIAQERNQTLLEILPIVSWALGGAIAVGSICWFLVRRSADIIKLQESREQHQTKRHEYVVAAILNANNGLSAEERTQMMAKIMEPRVLKKLSFEPSS